VADEEAENERRFLRARCASRRLAGSLDLQERESRVIKKDAAGGRQFDAASTALQQGHADFNFQVSDLPAEGRLGRMEPPLGGIRQASFLGDRNEVAQVTELHCE
jgi:hypothetical protein